ncbi:hypothetical protein BpHYR1_051768 [Brachionus plicatilis]|uniref:Uncharacterized protein n=1 Tax=Brachionus plicatilis TaxID=10195 RepID=A0A3M7R722_BRAPC|nr:hypothetical protein BpHYR1_051768 [Brachionus plicatilis]
MLAAFLRSDSDSSLGFLSFEICSFFADEFVKLSSVVARCNGVVVVGLKLADGVYSDLVDGVVVAVVEVLVVVVVMVARGSSLNKAFEFSLYQYLELGEIFELVTTQIVDVIVGQIDESEAVPQVIKALVLEQADPIVLEIQVLDIGESKKRMGLDCFEAVRVEAHISGQLNRLLVVYVQQIEHGTVNYVLAHRWVKIACAFAGTNGSAVAVEKVAAVALIAPTMVVVRAHKVRWLRIGDQLFPIINLVVEITALHCLVKAIAHIGKISD